MCEDGKSSSFSTLKDGNICIGPTTIAGSERHQGGRECREPLAIEIVEDTLMLQLELEGKG